MKAYSSNAILFSQHIPKTAGTSFTEVLKKWFYPGLHAHYVDHQTNTPPRKIHPVKKTLHYLGVYPLCIHGHFEEEHGIFESYPNASQFITVIRDPLEMQVSLFYDHQRRLKENGTLYWKGRQVKQEFGGDLDQWVEERPSYLLKFFPWKLTIENYQKVIQEHFIHIGITENLQTSVNIFAEKLGKKRTEISHKNESERSSSPSESASRVFKEKHTLEYMLYDYVLSLNRMYQ
jgi:hypothetical protein